MPPNLGNLYCLFSQNNCIKGTVSVISIVNLYAALAIPDSQHVPFVWSSMIIYQCLHISKTDYFNNSFCIQVTCALLLKNNIKELSELKTCKSRKTSLLISQRFQG